MTFSSPMAQKHVLWIVALLCALQFAAAAKTTRHTFQNRVILIRHGEKPPVGNELSIKGKRRAQCLRTLFGKESSKFDVGYIIAQDYDRVTMSKSRPYMTVKPLAHDLGLKVNLECERDDKKCVEDVVVRYDKEKGNKDILVSWKHSYLHEIAEYLSHLKHIAPYPDARFDYIWIVQHKSIKIYQQHCPGIDDDHTEDDYLTLEDGESELEELFHIQADELSFDFDLDGLID